MDAIGPEILKFKKSEKVITKWSRSVYQVVTGWSPSITKNMVLNSLSILKYVLVVLDDTGTLQQKQDS